MHKILGKFLYGLGKTLDVVLGFLIDFNEGVSRITKTLRSLLGVVAFMAILFLMMTFVGGILGIMLLTKLLPLMLILIVIPLVSDFLLERFTYRRFVWTEYLYDRSSFYIDGKEPAFSNLSGYKEEFHRRKEEARRREEERIRREQEARWRQEQAAREEARRQWEEMFSGRFNSNSSYGNTSYGPVNMGFKEEYERSCQLLGLDYSAGPDEIKSAYRSMAKKYHPDLNKDPGATEKFQQINDAYEFLSEDNIARYRNFN